MPKSRSRVHRRMCVIARDCMLTNPLLNESELTELIKSYGSRHFTNPRRLKRFINSFRLQFYLASIADVPSSPESLMRFVVLAEKYPSDPAQAPAPGLADSDGEPLGERYSA